ncbi:uncharacterized protein RHO17_013155 isoform 5-T5 [Thomomys bottae]
MNAVRCSPRRTACSANCSWHFVTVARNKLRWYCLCHWALGSSLAIGYICRRSTVKTEKKIKTPRSPIFQFGFFWDFDQAIKPFSATH